MPPDFPAAHSMDTDWFAVDKCGHVALFRSGESGAVPVEARILIGPDGGDEKLGNALFGPLTEEMEEDDDLVYPDTAAHGVFEYEHETENWISGPYARHEPPEKPVRLGDLPPQVKEKLKRLEFRSLCFQETSKIQPVEHAACASWEGAWLSLDGKQARPMPGMEKEYREIYDNVAKESASDGITWEPPGEASAAASAAPPATGGFLGWLKRLFGGS
ncbi:MAG TPA: hypothetical protein VNM14_14555 [Planctomycetota bacterium]|nr:hypothetical protein [Planctomycetota bacterium]